MINKVIKYLRDRKNPYLLGTKLINKIINFLDNAVDNNKYTENPLEIASYQYNLESLNRIAKRLDKINGSAYSSKKLLENINTARHNLKDLAKKHDEIKGFCYLTLKAVSKEGALIPVKGFLSYDERRDKAKSLYEQALICHKNYIENMREARNICSWVLNIIKNESTLNPKNDRQGIME